MIALAAILGTLYLIAMAVTFGGTIGVALITAPALFKKFDPRHAGDAFGLVLRRFDRLGVIVGLIAVLSVGAQALILGSHVGVRGALCGATALGVLALFWTSRNVLMPALEPLSPPRDPDAEDERSDEEKAAFDALHKRHVQVYTWLLFTSLAGLVFFAL